MDSHKKIYTYFTENKYVPKNFFHPRMTLGWINHEFDFFAIPLSPLKMQKKFKIFWLQVFLDILGASLAKTIGVPMS